MMFLTAPNINMVLKLRPKGSVPPEMLVIPGGMIGLAYPLAQAPAGWIDDFLIDRHEVTNKCYKKFVDAGGYRKRDYWKEKPVVDNVFKVYEALNAYDKGDLSAKAEETTSTERRWPISATAWAGFKGRST